MTQNASKPIASKMTPLQDPLALLGDMSPQTFMATHWQRKPLLIRNALNVNGLLPSREELFELALSQDVESRLVSHDAQQGWQLQRGPLNDLPAMDQGVWSLLVQGVNLHDERAAALLSRFRFVPDARVDDIMVSWATDGAGVGPHQDRYDVFLLQVEGRRHWRIAPPKDYQLIDGLPLKIIDGFEATEEWVLEPGDMLYLPPLWGHDGIAKGDGCMTCSIGFTVPQAGDLARELVMRMAEHWDAKPLYSDPGQAATQTPGAIPDALQAFAKTSVEEMMAEPRSLACALGEWLTEPKLNVWFEPNEDGWSGGAAVLDRRTKMLYDNEHVFINGEGFFAAGQDATVLRQMADARALSLLSWQQLSDDAQAVLQQWHELGWIHAFAAD